MIRVWYHGNCYDGFGAAWVAWRKFGKKAEYAPCFYGGDLPEHNAGDEIYILDFSFPRGQLLALNEICKVLVLDHHKTAQADLEGLDFCIFDMERSGAGMAWDHFFPELCRPPMVDFIEDRDLWKFRHTSTKPFQAYLRSIPLDFDEWLNLCSLMVTDTGFRAVIVEGAAIERFTAAEVGRICSRYWVADVKGHKVAVVNATSFFSEVCHELLQLCPEADFAMSFGQGEKGVLWSLRGRGDFDVSEIAKQWGGGGHKSAAGMRTKTIEEVLGR